jgi:hypothetical protein
MADGSTSTWNKGATLTVQAADVSRPGTAGSLSSS